MGRVATNRVCNMDWLYADGPPIGHLCAGLDQSQRSNGLQDMDGHGHDEKHGLERVWTIDLDVMPVVVNASSALQHTLAHGGYVARLQVIPHPTRPHRSRLQVTPQSGQAAYTDRRVRRAPMKTCQHTMRLAVAAAIV